MIPVCEDDEDVGSDKLNHNVRQLGRITGKMVLFFSCDGEFQI